MTTQEKLVAIYEQAEKKLRDIIRKKGTYSDAAMYQRSLLRQIEAELKKLRGTSSAVVNELVSENYQTGLEELTKEVQNVPATALSDVSVGAGGESPSVVKGTTAKTAELIMSRLNKKQIEVIARNTTSDFNRAINLIGRRVKDFIREETLEATAEKLSTGQTVRQMQKNLEEKLKTKNITAVPYKNGAEMPLKKYAEMAARSTTAEAQNTAKTVQGAEWGYEFVRMTSHSPTCPVCAQYQGRVYATTKEAAEGKYKLKDGTVLKFPYLYETAFASGYQTIHPNCRHRIAVIPLEAYTNEELKKFSSDSTKPFEDTRSDRERKAYAADQARKRKQNEQRKQYEKIKQVLPDTAPKSYAGFVRMKATNSQRYQDLMQDYRYILKQSKNSEKTVEKLADGGIIKTEGIEKANAIFVHKNDKLAEYAKNIEPIEGFDDFTCHATPDYFEIDTVGNGDSKDYVKYSPKEYADIIKNSKSFTGGSIRIISCQAGAKEDGAAQILSDELGVVVRAPTETVSVDQDGRMFISDNDILAEMWFEAEDKSTIKETGTWIDFIPRKE